MKTHTLIAAIAAVTSVAIPMLSQAASNKVAVDSCVKAFVATLSNQDGSIPLVRQTRFIDDLSNVLNSYPSQVSELTMTATNPRDSREVASAVCKVNTQGDVISIKPMLIAAL